MEVIRAIPCGYCKGVIRAIEIAKKERRMHPEEPIHILGMLVHNRFVTLTLSELNIISHSEKNKTRLELLDEIDSGTVIFSAHGVSNEIYRKAEEKGLRIVDATCTDVLKTKEIVKQHLVQEEVLYIGVKHHPEAEGIINDDPEHIHLITSIEDVALLPQYERVFVTNQTTMNMLELPDILKAIQKKYPQAEISEEICDATRMRQEAVRNLPELDILYVVGDPHSNNTRNLGKCAPSSIGMIRYIETVEDIDPHELENVKKAGVTAGASTPTALYQQVIAYLRNYTPSAAVPKRTDDIL